MSEKSVSKNQNGVPFAGLEDFNSGFYHYVKIATNDPRVIVKVAKTQWEENRKPGKTFPLNDLKATKNDVDMLVANFAEYVPPTQIVIGKNGQGENDIPRSKLRGI